MINAFLCGLHMGLLWARLVEKILEQSIKEMTKIMVVTINVKYMTKYHQSRPKNHHHKRKNEDKSKNLQSKKSKVGDRKRTGPKYYW